MAWFGPQRQPEPPADGWLPPVAPSRLPPRAFSPWQQQAYVAPVREPEPTADGWLPPVAPGRIIRPAFPAWQQQAFVAPAMEPVPPAGGWLPQTNPLAPRARPALRTDQHRALWMPTREPVPDMGWLTGSAAQRLRQGRQQPPATPWVPGGDDPSVVPDFGWWQPASQPRPLSPFRFWLYRSVYLPTLVPPRPLIRPGRILPLLFDTRDILLSPDSRAVQLAPDVRLIILPVDEDDMPPTPPQYWSPAASADEDFYWLSLARWLPPDDTVSDPSVVVTSPLAGDTNPVVVVPDSVVIDTGDRTVYVPPGVGPVVDPGPRIQMELTGGSKGYDYTTTITWKDSQGRTMNRQAILPIQW